MDDEEMTPLLKLFLLDPKAHDKRCNGIKIPHEVTSTVRAKQIFVQHHPGRQGLAGPSVTASYILTGPTADTKSITRKGRLTALLSPWTVNSTRIASTHACTVPCSRDLAPDKR